MKSIWSGNISFGLINIPVRLFSAARSLALSFKFLRKKDLCPIRNVRVCANTGEQVMYNDIVRGFEIEKNEFVVLEDKDIKRLNTKTDQAIEVAKFVSKDTIKPEYTAKPYYIEPQGKAEKAYAIFREALKKSGKVAVCNFIMKTREHLAAIFPEGDFLLLIELRYSDEMIGTDNIIMPRRKDISKEEIEMALKLIDAMSGEFNLDDYKDRRSEELRRVIKQKAKGRLPKIQPKKKAAPTEAKDIMAQLKESLEMTKKK